MNEVRSDPTAWPALPYPEWQATCETLQLWTQVVGKVRLAQTPWLNHAWHVPLYVTARGLETSLIHHRTGAFDIAFDFIEQRLVLRSANGASRTFALEPMSVAAFHAAVLEALVGMGLPVSIHGAPNEMAAAVPFAKDHAPRAYDRDSAHRFWRILVQAHRVMGRFRTAFLGKASPVHFFWGSFDLAVSRFSGRAAPPHPGGAPHLPDAVAREAYSHEVSSAGFWPGGGLVPYPTFYAYAYPEPAGFRDASVRPAQAAYNAELGEYLLPYDAVRTAADPDAVLMDFLVSTYEAAADAGGWDRRTLECALGVPGVPRPA